MDTNYVLPLHADAPESRRPAFLLKTVYRVYRERFGTWFAIIAPTSLVAAATLIIVDYRTREIYHSIPRGEISHHKADIVEIGLLRFAGFFFSWLLGCFALGAISSEINADAEKEEDKGPWKHDAHQQTRQHFGQVLSIACLSFFAFLVGLALAQVVEFAAGKTLGHQRFGPFAYWAGVAGYIVVASIASWLGAAVPLVVKGDCSVWAALKTSIALSSGYEGAFLWLVLQSVLGSYAGWYLTHYLAGALLPHAILHTVLGYWSVIAAAVLASAAADPPIFIAFSLLANPGKFREPLSFPSAQQPSHINNLG